MKLYENFINDGTLTNFYGGKTDSGYKLQINGEEKMKDKELTTRKMTAKEKAHELVDKMEKDFQYFASKQIAIQHALIAVDEMLSNDGWSSSSNEWNTFKNYFEQVKHELTKQQEQ